MNFDRTKIEVRRMKESDLDDALRIAENLEDAPHWPRQFYAEVLAANPARQRIALVAMGHQDTGIVGFTVAGLVPPESELETIAVAANAQRHGIGRQLLAALAEELRRTSIAELRLEVRCSNLAARHFYETQNFKQTGVRKRYYADPQEDAVLMSLRLA